MINLILPPSSKLELSLATWPAERLSLVKTAANIVDEKCGVISVIVRVISHTSLYSGAGGGAIVNTRRGLYKIRDKKIVLF